MYESGADILELGVPFSDPTADGPVIQRSSARALKAGIHLADVLEMTRRIRQISDVPIILFSYYNPIMAYGVEKFYKDSVSAGADGVLVVDLPPEESEELTGEWKDDAFCLIRLVAPTTPEDRMRTIAANSSGFLYMVSMTGVTGSGGLDTTETGQYVEKLRQVTELPICVGFGISTPSDVSAVSAVADGAVIGSAFESTIEDNLDNPDLPAIIGKQTAAYKDATR
ncbi:MAG: tryptophan synthase subunit alpha, partial [Desulfobacterales bacterium]|nr:tryptophan synthase subunit alpha [Desulfobacterales bacterium]